MDKLSKTIFNHSFFKMLNKQGVANIEGNIEKYSVQMKDRFSAEYREDKKTITFFVENEFVSKDICNIYIENNAFQKWDNGFSISVEKQKEIEKNFEDAMKFQGIRVLKRDIKAQAAFDVDVNKLR